MSKLYSSYTLRGLELSNRIVVSPMCQYSAENGLANDWHLVHLGSRAVGDAGLVFTEAAAVSPEGRISPSDLGIWSEEHIEPLKRITTFIRAQGVSSGIQLAHAGRKASCLTPWEGGQQISPLAGGWQTVAPTAMPFYEDDVAPIELSVEEIQAIIQSFVNAAPLTNKRKDKYGGSFENRMRLLIEVTIGIRAVIPQEMPLFVRISAEEWASGGHTIEESLEVAKLLKTNGVDLIDCSSGAVVRQQNILVKVNYQVPFAERIKKETNIATGAVGLITDIFQAEDILDKDEADLIFIGREMLRNPYFALLGADQMHIIPNWPKQYERGKLRK